MSRAFDLLNECIHLTDDVLAECQSNRMPYPDHCWIWSLLARMAYSARSAAPLLRAEQYWDLRLIIRAIHDAYIDILYILHDPARLQELRPLISIEALVDEYNDFQHLQDLLSLCPDGEDLNEVYSYAKQRLEEAERHFRWATSHRAFRASPKVWPKRWLLITQDEKLKAIRRTGERIPTEILKYQIRQLGNAAAHSRWSMLQHFWRKAEDGSFRLSTTPRHNKLLDVPYVLVFVVFTYLIDATWRVVDAFYLEQVYEDRVKHLLDEWRPTSAHT